MIRTLLVLFGIVEVLVPNPIIDICERIGLENPDDARLRPRAALLARIEGAAIVWLLVRGRSRSPLASAFFGSVGLLAVLFPTPLIRLSQRVAYENPNDLELKYWVRPATRLLGVLYLAVVVLSADDSDAGHDPTSG